MEALELEPDAVMPVQFGEAKGHESPSIALLWAVLENALRALKVDTEAGDEAKRWFDSNSTRWPLSFVNLCSYLKIDHSYWRAIASKLYGGRLMIIRGHRSPVINRIDRLRKGGFTRQKALRSTLSPVRPLDKPIPDPASE